MSINIQQLQAAFCETMFAKGYAAGREFDQFGFGEKKMFMEVVHPSGVLMIDCYWLNETTRYSAGQTVILNSLTSNTFEPLWVMNYGGYYPKNITPFLKKALGAAYEANRFVGGRGPETFQHPNYPGLIYTNTVEGENRFALFRGREWIAKDGEDAPLGWHEYSGMLLMR